MCTYVKIIIIIVVILLYLLIFVKKNDIYQDDPIYDYKDVRNKFKSGDIILFSCKKNDSLYNSIEYYFRTKFIGSEYGHVGIIIKNNNQFYVIECIPYNYCADEYAHYLNNEKKGGIRIIELDKLLNVYSNSYAALFAVKFISEEIPKYILFEKLFKYSDKIFDDKNKLMILGIIDVCISNTIAQLLSSYWDKNKMMCSEFVHNFLYNCGTLKEYPSKIFWPHLLTDDNLFSSLEIVTYSKPYKFKFIK